MTNTRLSSKLAVGPQISPEEVGRIAAEGFKGIINNRPDGEAADQPGSVEIEAEARRHGLGYWHIPVSPGEATEADARAFAEALEGCEGPVIAFCRTGNRSTMLARMAGQAGEPEPDGADA